MKDNVVVAGPYGDDVDVVQIANSMGGQAVDYEVLGSTVGLTDPQGLVRTSLRRVAHDSGDGETLYHCPFCGGGQIIARSDGTTECGFCNSVFTVQVQPKYPAMPQTINGVPQQMPGMPGTPGQPGAAQETSQPDAGPSDVFEPPEAQVPSFQPPDGAVAASRRERMYVTAKGMALPEDAFLRHLAINFADDREAVIEQVKASR